MDGIAFQSESHQDGFDTEYLFEVADDRDTSSTANGQRFLSEGFFKSFFGCLIGRMVDGADIAFTAMQGSDFYLYIVGGLLGEVVYKQLGNFSCCWWGTRRLDTLA